MKYKWIHKLELIEILLTKTCNRSELLDKIELPCFKLSVKNTTSLKGDFDQLNY